MLMLRSGPTVYGDTVICFCALTVAVLAPTAQETWAVLVITVPTGVAALTILGTSTANTVNHTRKVRAIRANMPLSAWVTFRSRLVDDRVKTYDHRLTAFQFACEISRLGWQCLRTTHYAKGDVDCAS